MCHGWPRAPAGARCHSRPDRGQHRRPPDRRTSLQRPSRSTSKPSGNWSSGAITCSKHPMNRPIQIPSTQAWRVQSSPPTSPSHTSSGLDQPPPGSPLLGDREQPISRRAAVVQLAAERGRDRRASDGPDEAADHPRKGVPLVPLDLIRQILADCDGRDLISRPDTAIIWLLWDTGCRLSEIGDLTVDDIDLDLDVIHGDRCADRQSACRAGRARASRTSPAASPRGPCGWAGFPATASFSTARPTATTSCSWAGKACAASRGNQPNGKTTWLRWRA